MEYVTEETETEIPEVTQDLVEALKVLGEETISQFTPQL